MTVKQLAEILNQMIKDGKGDYEVCNLDYEDVVRIETDDACKSTRIV